MQEGGTGLWIWGDIWKLVGGVLALLKKKRLLDDK